MYFNSFNFLKSYTQITPGSENSAENQISNIKKPINLKINLPILMYHSIDDFKSLNFTDPNIKLSYGMRIPPNIFREQLQLLKLNNYNTITFEQLEKYTNGVIELPFKPIILTFDDGWKDNMNAYNILKEFNYVGNFAIITNFIGKPSRLNETDIIEISKTMEISSHSQTHPNLTTLNIKNLKSEVAESKAMLEKLIGKKINTFIYPTGAFNKDVINEVKNNGYTFGVTTIPFKDNVDLEKNYEITRIRLECPYILKNTKNICTNLGNSFFQNLKK